MPIEKMNVSLPPKMARSIRGEVKAGDYTNASEAVRDAVCHMQEVEVARQLRRASAAMEDSGDATIGVSEGYEAIKNGEYVDIDGDDGLVAYFDGTRDRAKKELTATARHGC